MRKPPTDTPIAATADIRVEGARSHNLKGVSCRIPLRQLTVVTGVSGSGKSTLAFDTLYAEGQRRYVTSLSTYARQFLERLPRPQVDSISNVPPAIAIEQRNTVSNARSTVGTATEILDHLRVLFARVGETRCPDCDLPVAEGTASGVAETLLDAFAGRRVLVAAALVAPADESDAELRERLLRDGYTRLLDPGDRVVGLEDALPGEIASLRESALLLIDRLAIPAAEPTDADRARVAEAVADAFGRGSGELVIVPAVPEEARPAPRRFFREGFRCDGCGRRFPAPAPPLFSFNSPLGACQECQGFGRVTGIDFARVVPDPSKSLADDAIAPFTTRMGRHLQRDLMAACRELGIPTDVPFESLSHDHRRLVFEGDEDQGGDWYGVRGFFEWLERRRYKVQARALIARYRRYDTCSECDGSRLSEDARCVRVGGRSLPEVCRDTLEELRAWLGALELSPGDRARVGRLLEALRARLDTVVTVGLGYVGLDRQTRTLSGGEAQRIQLATALGGTLTSSLYVLDEPSIGLHPRDVDKLVSVLQRVRDHGNTVVVVEHAPEIVSRADHVIDLGPGAGSHGGEVVVEGTVEDVRAHPTSATGRALRGELRGPARPPRKRGDVQSLRIVGAREHNLRDLTVEIPLRCLVAVTGVSGAGKSTLIDRVLVGNALAFRDEAESGQRGEPGACDRIEGLGALEQVVVVDQSPASRSPRSNPATVSKAFDAIRARFAETREAKALGVSPGWFSFNVAGGRCEKCEGSGEIVIDMQFLDDVRVPCEVCGGTRYRREVLQVRLDGRSIRDVLDLTLDEAVVAFADDRRIVTRLDPLVRVGLGYLRLGQPLSTLSGGEHQRVRLAQAMGTARAGGRGGRGPGLLGTRLFVLDEPTKGLHPADVEILLGCLDELIETEGASVIVIEHNLDVIRRADHVLDLGPEGGPHGGCLVAAGTPREVAANPQSATGRALASSPAFSGSG